MTKQTRRKVKIIGREQYIDSKTGELKDFQVIDIQEKDANFHKFWLFNVINSLDLIGNKKIKFAFWLIENMDSDNKICWTLRQMAEKSGVSLDTVRITMQALMESHFLVRQNIANYQINPDAIFKGGKEKRLRILLDYHATIAEQTKQAETASKTPNREDRPQSIQKNEKHAQTASQARKKQTRKQRKARNLKQQQQQKQGA